MKAEAFCWCLYISGPFCPSQVPRGMSKQDTKHLQVMCDLVSWPNSYAWSIQSQCEATLGSLIVGKSKDGVRSDFDFVLMNACIPSTPMTGASTCQHALVLELWLQGGAEWANKETITDLTGHLQCTCVCLGTHGLISETQICYWRDPPGFSLFSFPSLNKRPLCIKCGIMERLSKTTSLAGD